ncbi:MAG: hypothetical protein ACXAEI_16665, partial [Candidatus Hodarchaeales archaeon]
MTEVYQPLDARILYFPKCPYYKPVLQWALRLALMVLGTIGLSFLHFWVAVAYLIYYGTFFLWAMPVKHCQYCYYSVTESTRDSKTGKTSATLMPLDKWKEAYLQKHVDCGKKWGVNFMMLWFLPILLIGIALFLSFSILALLSLIGFIVVLAVTLVHMKWKVCPTCAIVEECH